METYRLHRGRLIDHIQLVVNDFEASKAFYTAVLAVLEIPVVNTYDDYFWADELVVSSINSPGSAGKPTGRHHLAFQARDRETVDAFYQAALAHGGSDNGAPGERTYHPGYYAAFVLDPDGNNIEAVYHGEGNAVRHRWRLASVFKYNGLRAGPYWAVGIKSDQEPAHELAISKPS